MNDEEKNEGRAVTQRISTAHIREQSDNYTEKELDAIERLAARHYVDCLLYIAYYNTIYGITKEETHE